MTDIKKVTVLGTGVLGSQIAFQTAFRGFDVTAYDINDSALEQARKRFANLAGTYAKDVAGADQASLDRTANGISLSCNLADAVADADLIIEAVPEVLEIKQELYQQLANVAPQKTIFATNSSTLLPSAMKEFTGRPDRFLGLHFANNIWKFNTAEVMRTPDTDQTIFDTVIAFARAIGMVPVPIQKEKAGYALNSMLVPFLNAALELVAGGYATPEDVDNVWRIDTGAPMGPFQIYDVIGLNTPYNIMAHGSEHDQKLAAWLKENYMDKGRLGVASGEGFYSYSQST